MKKQCKYCGKWFKSLGFASHRSACRKNFRKIADKHSFDDIWEAIEPIKPPMKDEDILKLDFYDFCGTASIFMTDAEKIEYYKEHISKTEIMSREQDLQKRTEQALTMPVVMQRYSLLRQQSAMTGEMFETWYRPDMMLFVERWVLEKGEVVDKYRILPNTNDVNKVGHIDFTKHYYDNFEEAVKVMVSLNIA